MMRKHIALAFCLVAAGCTDSDWDRALNYVYPAPDDADVTSDASPQPAAVAQPATTIATPQAAAAPAAPANADFCRAVATQDATSNGFDPATQQRVYARSYGQCVAMYSR